MLINQVREQREHFQKVYSPQKVESEGLTFLRSFNWEGLWFLVEPVLLAELKLLKNVHPGPPSRVVHLLYCRSISYHRRRVALSD